MRGKMRWPAQTSQQLLRSRHPANYYKNLTFGRTRPFNAFQRQISFRNPRSNSQTGKPDGILRKLRPHPAICGHADEKPPAELLTVRIVRDIFELLVRVGVVPRR